MCADTGVQAPLILFVDDESHLRVTVKDFLEFHGYQVDLAHSGEQALRRIKQRVPDMVVLDVSMPGIGGMGFLNRIQNSKQPIPPILILTARSNLRSFFEGVNVAGFLAKPCSKELLLNKIKTILADQTSRSEKNKGDARHILLGEDDKDMAEMLARALKRSGHQVTMAKSGPAVLESAPAAKPDVVVLKHYLTGLNGGPVASLLRAMPTTAKVPILVYNTAGINAAVVPESKAGSRDVNRYVVARDSGDILDAIQLTLASA